MVSTTGIKCEGSSVMLQGVPYPQPYVIEAVGDVGDLTAAISDDDYLQVYREQSDDPAIAVGWDLDLEDEIKAPAYDGLLDLTYATPIDPPGAVLTRTVDRAEPSRRRLVGSVGVGSVERRRGRRLVGRDEQRDHGALACGSPPAAAGRSRCPWLGGLRVGADVV